MVSKFEVWDFDSRIGEYYLQCHEYKGAWSEFLNLWFL